MGSAPAEGEPWCSSVSVYASCGLALQYLELQSLQETHEVMLRDQQRQISKYQLQTVTTQLKGLTQEAETEAEV